MRDSSTTAAAHMTKGGSMHVGTEFTIYGYAGRGDGTIGATAMKRIKTESGSKAVPILGATDFMGRHGLTWAGPTWPATRKDAQAAAAWSLEMNVAPRGT